jgi:hypothetical protein
MAKPRGDCLRPWKLRIGYSDDGETFEIAIQLPTEDVEAYMGGPGLPSVMRARTPDGSDDASGVPSFSPLDFLTALKDDGLIELLRFRRDGRPSKEDEIWMLQQYDDYQATKKNPRHGNREFIRRYLGTQDEARVRAGLSTLRRILKKRLARKSP